AVLDARKAAPPAPLWLSLQAGAATDRKLARPHPRSGAEVTRTCTRSRRMRTADQGLWRYARALAGQIAPARAVDALASARTAALVDPEGEGLAKCLADVDGPAMRIAAE